MTSQNALPAPPSFPFSNELRHYCPLVKTSKQKSQAESRAFSAWPELPTQQHDPSREK